MLARLCHAAVAAALVFLSFASASQAQAQPSSGAANVDGYKPPARFIAKEEYKDRKTAPSRHEASLRTIGLVSLLGDAATVKKVGVMVFGNELHKVPIPSWKLDEQVGGFVQQMLKKTFRIKTIPVPAEAFDKFNAGSFFLKSYDDELLKFLSGYVGTQHCDYYLLVLPAFDRISTTNQEVGGVGVLRLESVFNSNPEYIYAFYRLAALDGHLKPLRSESDFDVKLTLLPDVLRGPNYKMKDGERLPEDANAAIADPRTHRIVWDLLKQSLEKTLPKLFATS